MLSALFMYSLIHESTNLYVRCCCWGAKWRHQLSSWRPFLFFVVILSWNWTLCKSSFHKETTAVVQQPGRQSEACSAFCLPPWLTKCHCRFVTSPKKQNKKCGKPAKPEARTPLSATITNLIYCLVLTGGRSRQRVIWKKWGSHRGEKTRKSREIRGEVRKRLQRRYQRHHRADQQRHC